MGARSAIPNVIQKIEQALKGAYEALSIARQAGVRIGSGSRGGTIVADRRP